MRVSAGITLCLVLLCPANFDRLAGQTVGLDQITEMIQKGQHRTAERLLEELLKQQESGRAHFLLGFIRIQTFRYQEAEASLRKAIELEPERQDWLMALAKSLLEQGQNRAASEVLDRALKLGRSPEILFARAMCRLNLGRPDDAEIDLADALKMQPDNAEIHFKLGKIELDRGGYERAAERLESALQLDPELLEARFLLGLCQRRQGNLEPARDLFLQVLTNTPGHVGALYNLGQILAQLGDQKGARLKLEQFRTASRLQDEIEFYRRAVNKNPENQAGRIELSRMLLKNGHTQEALEHLMVAQRLDRTSAEAYRLLVTTFLRLGRQQEAEWASRLARRFAGSDQGPRE